MTNEPTAGAELPNEPVEAAPTEEESASPREAATSEAEAAAGIDAETLEPRLQSAEDVEGVQRPEDAEERLPEEIVHAPVEVELQRSVRIGRIVIGAAILGAVIGVIASLFFPVEEGADYELGQVAGQMVVFGGAIGLTVGAILALLLGMLSKRKKGAAIVVQTDVR